ncbi:MAG: hypothetical protein IIW93_09225 [Bacteroidaceae bacterium]|nr:hypothetical protein [Bacteroidaceae bacterium]
MKRIVLWVVSLVLVSANVFADGLTATLQQGERMTPFYGVDAFKQAYAAADSGAVITLSAGTFNNVDTIAKSIKVIGNYAFNASSPENTNLTRAIIAANKVTIDGIYFSGSVTLGNIEDCKIVHSWIENTLAYSSTSAWHTNTIVDQCVIKTETAIKQGRNYTIKNSTINKFDANNTSANIAYITNCVIYDFVYNHTKPSSNVKGIDIYPSIPVAIYKNNVLGIDVSCYYHCYSTSTGYSHYYYNVCFSSPSEFYYNKYAMTYYMYTTGSYYYTYDGSKVYYTSGCQNAGNTKEKRGFVVSGTQYPAVLTNPGYGQDGTLRGPQGGTGFSPYPSIPRVTSKTIDSNTDADGKLNVKITVKAQ